MSQWTEIAHRVLDALKEQRHTLSSAIREDKYPERLAFLRGQLRVIEQTRDSLLDRLTEEGNEDLAVYALESDAYLGRDEAKQRLADCLIRGGLVDYERGRVAAHVFVLETLKNAKKTVPLEQESSLEQ